jgi:hypothetical protein
MMHLIIPCLILALVCGSNIERANSGSRQGVNSERSRSKIQTRRFSNGCDHNIVDPNIRTVYVFQKQAQAMGGGRWLDCAPRDHLRIRASGQMRAGVFATLTLLISVELVHNRIQASR